jgi:CubicO group peptidase (beta-lactamase class C family)
MKYIWQKVNGALILVGVLLFVPCAVFASGEPELARSAPFVAADTPEDVGLSSERLSRIDSFMRRYVDSESIAGAVVMVGRRGKIAYLKSFGMADIEAGRPMQSDTLFRIAGMTKCLTAVAMMTLYEEGHFLLNDPVSKFIPEFAEMQVLVPEGDSYTLVPAERPITIRHLLTNTSGITYRFYGHPHISELYKQADIYDLNMPASHQPDRTAGEMVRRLATLPLRKQPGESFGYSLGMEVIGHVIEVVSGKPLDSFMNERIFGPLGMQDTHFYLPAEKVSRLAAAYKPNPAGGLERWGEGVYEMGNLVLSTSYPYDGPPTYFLGGNGLTTTITDLGRFLQMMLNGGELEGMRILSRKTVELMTCNHIEGLYTATRQRAWDGDKFGLGFAIRTERGEFDEVESLGCYGWGGLFSNHFWVDPGEDMFGIMLAQHFPFNYMPLRRETRILINQAIID